MTKPHEQAPIAVVLLDHNGGEKLAHCLRSLAQQTILPARLILVDNGSKDYNPEKVKSLLGERYHAILEFLPLDKNYGYAIGMNRGIKKMMQDQSSHEWIITLNNDTELEPIFFERLLKVLKNSDKQLGMIAPKVRAMDRRDYLDGTGLAICLDGMSTARGQRERDCGQYDHRVEVIAPNGVAAVYRSTMLEDIGLLDEQFGSYCEDTDLGLRGWIAGWNCKFVPNCIVYHARSSSMGEHSLFKLYFTERNHLWVAIKNFPLPLLALKVFFIPMRYLVQTYSVIVGKGLGARYTDAHSLPAIALTSVRAFIAALFGVPFAFRSRLHVQAKRRRSNLAVMRTLWRERLTFRELILK